jgi:hypothetical protein
VIFLIFHTVDLVIDTVGSRHRFYYDFPGTNLDQWIEQVRKIDSLKFEVMMGGQVSR